MRLLCITDLHDRRAVLERILTDAGEVDMILLGGDITSFGSPEDAQRIVRLAQTSVPAVLAVAGNCDSAEIDARLDELGVGLHGRGVICRGIGFCGLSAMPPWLPRMYHFTEKELTGFLEAGYAQIAGADHQVVLSHCPPRGGRLDRTRFFQHVGSKALRAFIARTQPALVVCGHIHEARGIDSAGSTAVVNCGPATAGYYATAEVGDRLNVQLHRV